LSIGGNTNTLKNILNVWEDLMVLIGNKRTVTSGFEPKLKTLVTLRNRASLIDTLMTGKRCGKGLIMKHYPLFMHLLIFLLLIGCNEKSETPVCICPEETPSPWEGNYACSVVINQEDCGYGLDFGDSIAVEFYSKIYQDDTIVIEGYEAGWDPFYNSGFGISDPVITKDGDYIDRTWYAIQVEFTDLGRHFAVILYLNHSRALETDPNNYTFYCTDEYRIWGSR
jgi:hypothetical protein